MSWATKYTVEWTDILGVDWKVNIEEDAFAGSVTTLQATGSPLTIEYLSLDDKMFESPIKGSKADLNVYSDTDFALADLYTVQDQKFRMSVYYYNAGDVLYWQGFNITDNYSEPYNHTSYQVTISASDGFGLLRDIKFDNAGTPYNGRTSQRDIIIKILAKIGISTFTEYINIYEEGQSDAVGDSPLDQTYIDVDVFKDMYCYEVLNSILITYNAVIRQIASVIIIYRPIELTGSIIYGRVFTSSTKSATTSAPDQFINRDSISSDIVDREGGTLMIHSPAQKININQDYGNKESWLDNWELKGATYEPITYTFQNWLSHDSCATFPASRAYSGEPDGMWIASQNNLPISTTKYMYQSFGVNTMTTSDTFVIDIEYLIVNQSGTAQTGQAFLIALLSDTGNFYADFDSSYPDNYLVWFPSNRIIEITVDAPTQSVGWTRWTRQINGLPITGSYTFRVYGMDDTYPGIWPIIKNVKIYSTSDEVTIKKYKESYFPFVWRKRHTVIYRDDIEVVKKTYNPTCTPTKGKELDYDYIIGDVTDSAIDNVLDQFAGALSGREVQAAHVFNKCLIRNEEMNNSLSLTLSTLLEITDKTGQVITIDNLPDYDKFDLSGWVCMPCDEDHTTTTDPTPTGDYLYEEFCTIDRAAQTLTFATGVSLTNFAVGDNVVLYNAFLNYQFVGDQTTAPIVSLVGAPAWRSMMTGAGPMFRHTDGRFIMLFVGFEASPTRGNIGYVYSTDMVTWTIGNSDAAIYAATSFPLCTSVNLTGNCYPVAGSLGDYWCLVFYGRTSDGHGVQRIFYFDEDFTTFSYSDPIMADTDLGFGGGSILEIDGTYHLIYMLITAAGIDYRSINAASCVDLEGPYVDYQTNIVRGIDANDGMAWSYATDAPCIFNDGIRIFGVFGAQAMWSQSGTKGNRQYCLLDFDPDTEVWSASTNGPILVNPLYYQDLDGSYAWAGDHCGGYPCIFIEGADIYMSLTMKGSFYQVALLKMNNIGLEYPTSDWNTRGGTQSKPLLEVIGDELAYQYSRPKQFISLPIIEGNTNVLPHIDLLGNFQDILNSSYESYGQLISSFTNGNYETFTSSGTSILSAINSSGDGYCLSSLFDNVVTNTNYLVYFNLTLNSGNAPDVYLIDQPWTTDVSHSTVNGANYIILIAPFSGDAKIMFLNNANNGDYSTSPVVVCKLPRKFVFNRGTHDIANRELNIDLIEII